MVSLKQFLRKCIAFLEKRLSVTQRKWISITLGIIIPIAIYLYEKYCPVGSPWFQTIVPAIELVFPGIVIFLLWDEIGRLRGDAQTDKLTGLFNRRGVEEALIEEVSKRQQSLRGMTVQFPPFGVIGIDLDNFKKVNDTFGHSAGDKALVIIAEIMKSIFSRSESGSDITCRTGGDEFLVILANTTVEMTKVRAEMFRKAIEDDCRLHFVMFNVTVSIGVSTLKGVIETSREEDVKAALHNAIIATDCSTYLSKKNGRNSISDESTQSIVK